MLHGVGSNEQDLFWLLTHFEDYFVFSLQGPFNLGMGRYGWYTLDFSTGKRVYKFSEVLVWFAHIKDFIEDISQKHHLFPEQIYLFGFSQWAILSYFMLFHTPEKIHGVIGLSGRVIEELHDQKVMEEKYEWKKVFIGHGTLDNVIHPIEAQETEEFLQTLGITPTKKIYDIPHTISPQEIIDIQNWLKNE